MTVEQQTIQANLKALTIFDAENTMMSVEQYAKFIGKCYKTALNRIHDKSNQIIYTKNGGTYEIPKMQFLKEVVEKFKQEE